MTGSNLAAGMLGFRIYRSDKHKVAQVSAGEPTRRAYQEMNLGVGVSTFDTDFPYELVFELDSRDARDGFYDHQFAVYDMSDHT